MDEPGIMLEVGCYSEKEEVGFAFGIHISEEEKENKYISDPTDIANCIYDSYYELWFEFEPGIEKARKLIRENRFSNVKETLLEVFGHFKLGFTIDGVEEEFSCDLDLDECVFDMLTESNDFGQT